MDLYDIHVHDPLTSESDDDVPKQNITRVLNVFPLEFEYTKDNNTCQYYSCGIHPWYSDNIEPQLKFLTEIAIDDRVVAIGETGFDKLRGSDMKTQETVFEQQIRLSEDLKKPLIIHCVKAWDELLLMKKRHKPTQSWIIHGYRGKVEQTDQLLSHGFLFSIGEKYDASSLRRIPLDRIFCETDDSNLSIEAVYDNIALSLDLDVDFFAKHIKSNVRRVFPLIQFVD